MRAAVLGPLCAGVLAAACRHAPPAPADTLRAFGEAVERQDWVAAYELMTTEYRRRVTRAEFERRMRLPAAQAASAGGRLRDNADRWASRVVVSLDADQQVVLVREGGGWRLEGSPLEPFAQDTPRAALRAFIRAVEAERWDVLIELAPARYRADLTPEKLRAFWQAQGAARTVALLRDLRLALDGRIVEEGEEAFVVYGGGRQVRFVREDELWRIESPE